MCCLGLPEQREQRVRPSGEAARDVLGVGLDLLVVGHHTVDWQLDVLGQLA